MCANARSIGAEPGRRRGVWLGVKRAATATVHALGAGLLGWAAIDWLDYTRFALSLGRIVAPVPMSWSLSRWGGLGLTALVASVLAASAATVSLT